MLQFIRIACLLLLILPSLPLSAQPVIPLWPEGVPDCPVDSMYREEMRDIGRVTMAVQKPTIEVYLPAPYRANGQAVLICPGGGYYLQAYDWEGTEFAKWFNQQGIAAFVLKYRLPYWSGEGCRDHVALDDAQQAMRLIRSRADGWDIDVDQVGVMGFSAGGHLAATLSTHYTAGDPAGGSDLQDQSSRPDFSILIYPVISGDTSVYHGGSFRNLLGDNASEESIRFYSNDEQVTADTPPAFLLHAADDSAVPFQNSIRYFEACQRHGVSAELHILPSGGHGFAMADGHPSLDGWVELLRTWMATLVKSD